MAIRGTVTLRQREAPGFQPAVFVNGLVPATATVWIVPDGEAIKVRFKGERGGLTPEAVLSALKAIAPEAGRSWPILWQAAAKSDRNGNGEPEKPAEGHHEETIGRAAPCAEDRVPLAVDRDEPRDILEALRSDVRLSIITEALG